MVKFKTRYGEIDPAQLEEQKKGQFVKYGDTVVYHPYIPLQAVNFIPDEVADKAMAEIWDEEDKWFNELFDKILDRGKNEAKESEEQKPQTAEEWYYHFKNKK